MNVFASINDEAVERDNALQPLTTITKGTRAMAITNLTQSAGIYCITNTVNQHFYIGSAVNLQSRWHVHRASLRANKHHNPHLQSAWLKYGECAFEFTVLEYVYDNLVASEQKWLDYFDAANRSDCYNICPTAYSHVGVKRSAESRKRMSEAQHKANQSPERKAVASENIRKYNYSQRGVPQSEAHRRKISSALKGKKLLPERCAAMSKRAKGIPRPSLYRPVVQFNTQGEIVARFVSVNSASEAAGVSKTSISNCLRGRSKSAGGFVWRYE